jgi:hypothetical protein
VTVVLAAVYCGIVLGPTALVGFGGEHPGWLVAVGTLAAFALFAPVRRRVQRGIDHRFNRRQYDAERTIDIFAARLRDRVDLGDLQVELSRVVAGTMQPAHVSFWLPDAVRGPAATSAESVTIPGRQPTSIGMDETP